MNTNYPPPPHSAASRPLGVGLLAIAIGLAIALPSYGQMTPEEHAKHHPDQAKGAPPAPGMEGNDKAGAGGMAPAGKDAGMGGKMEGMMKKMGVPPPKDTYPSLMSLPELTPEKRQHLRQDAQERMHTGVALLAKGLDRLGNATEIEDYAAMHDATALVREGLARFESGLAAQRALADSKPPRQVALEWFKDEMNLQSPQGVEARGSSGLSAFHYFTMALLVVFAVAMLALYYFKMRRAAALFGRLDPDAKSPPPGSAPPPKEGGGGPTPPPGDNAPPGGKGPGAGGKDPPADNDPAAGGKADPPPEGKQLPPGDKAEPPPPGAEESPLPLTAKWRGRLAIESITRETPNIKTFRLRSPGGGPLPFLFLPGQFLNVALNIGGGRMNRSYSISSSPHERDYVDLSIKREDRGAFSRHVVDLWKVGDPVEANGPVGRMTFTGTEADSVVLISAGIGVTPMMSVARYLSEQSWPGDIFFIFTCRTPADYIFEKPLAALAKGNPKLHAVVSMTKPGPGWKGPRGRITKELLAESVPDIAGRRVHLCGPVPMMEATKALLSELGVASDHVKTEQFGAVKPPPTDPNAAAKPKAPATGPLVTFSTNSKSAKIGIDQTGEQAAIDTGPGQTILELSEELAIGIENSCRVGTCGVCKVKMTSGEVDQAIQDALDDDDKANGIILACQAKPKTPVTVEA
jgi:ferredoxin-NADP reductase